MFEEYKKEVLDFYQKKKAANGLSMNLMYPTRAKLRDECINVIRSRYLKKDKTAIEASFGELNDITAYLMRIKKCGAEKLKTLDNFLKDNRIGTDIKNIELLAWLIDFEPRPYRYDQVYSPPLAEQPAAAGPQTAEPPPASGQDGISEPVIGSGGTSTHGPSLIIELPQERRKQKRVLQAFFLSAVALAAAGLITWSVSFINQQPKRIYPALTGSEKCMVWEDDHYRPVPCNLKFDDRQVVALDTIQLKGFKKIMRNDTVTKSSINKLWYFKTGGHLELFTAPGFHPVHTDRKLRRLSEHMLFTYVHND